MDDSIYRLRQRDVLALCVLALLCLGVVMVQSAAMNVTGDVHWQWTPRGMRHLVFAMLATAAFFAVGHVDYGWLGRPTRRLARSPAVWLYAMAGFLCLIVLIPHVGVEVNGARRWLSLGFAQIQPSELGKWAVVLLLAWLLTHRREAMERFRSGFLAALLPVAAICLLVVIEDLGTAALIALCALTMFVAARIRISYIAAIVPPALAAGAWFVMSKEYRWRRMTAFLDPWATSREEGYHIIQSLLSFSSGGLTGRGLGNGVQKLGYLPEDTTDFIFAVVCEELGLFGALLVVALYLGIVYVAWQAVRRERDSFGKMLAFGVASMVGLQAVINIAVATVSIPTKGLSLPLVSAGGTGLIITCAALGLLYSVCKHERPAADAFGLDDAAQDRVRIDASEQDEDAGAWPPEAVWLEPVGTRP